MVNASPRPEANITRPQFITEIHLLSSEIARIIPRW